MIGSTSGTTTASGAADGASAIGGGNQRAGANTTG